MCTICGHFVKNGKIKTTDIYDMLIKMKHRGPDSHGAYLDGTLIRENPGTEERSLTEESYRFGAFKVEDCGTGESDATLYFLRW